MTSLKKLSDNQINICYDDGMYPYLEIGLQGGLKTEDKSKMVQLKNNIIKGLEARETAKKYLKGLDIFCRVCGERLTLQNSKDMMWGCSYMSNGKTKAGRFVSDKHYSESRVYMSFENYNTLCMLETYLNAIIGVKQKNVRC